MYIFGNADATPSQNVSEHSIFFSASFIPTTCPTMPLPPRRSRAADPTPSQRQSSGESNSRKHAIPRPLPPRRARPVDPPPSQRHSSGESNSREHARDEHGTVATQG